MSELLMSVKHISKVFEPKGNMEGFTALEDVNLNISEGSFTCILGPSGCGKSTLLNIMAGLLEPSSGKIMSNGVEAKGINPERTVVFQTPTLYPWLDVSSNVSFGPSVRGVKKAEIKSRCDYYLEEVGLIEFADSKPYELSGGMRQRVALARALVNDPKMIFLDEPFGALDAFTRNDMQILMRRVWKKNKVTALMITHDVDEALALATDIVVMSASPGRIIRELPVKFSERPINNSDDFRYSEEYLQLRKEIMSLLKRD